MELSQNNEMRWELKRIERGETGEDIRREEGETVGITDEDVKTIMDNVYMVIDRTHGTSHPVVMMEF